MENLTNPNDTHPELSKALPYIVAERSVEIQGWEETELPTPEKVLGIVRAHEESPNLNDVVFYSGIGKDGNKSFVTIGVGPHLMFPFKAFRNAQETVIILRATQMQYVDGQYVLWFAVAHFPTDHILEICTVGALGFAPPSATQN